MNELNQVFAFNHNAEEPCVIRVLGTRENPLFPATDVCRALGLTQITRALKGIDEQYLTFGKVVDSNGRERKTNCLTEIGLYLLTFRSNKPRAKVFSVWAAEVIRSVRKTGAYIHNGIDFSKMRELFLAAKTGSVQLAILQAAGIIPPPSLAAKPGKAARVRYEARDFWPAVLGLVESAALPILGCFRAERCSTNPVEAYHLMLLPGPVVQALAAGVGPFHRCRRDDMLASAKTWPGFVPGKHVQRFGAGAKAMVCWMFRSADKDGPLMRLIRLTLDQP